MTESDWLTGSDFAAHVHFAAGRLSPRRQRLLAAGFCRAVGHLFDHPDLHAALKTVEWFADGRDSAAELEKARQRCRFLALEAYEAYARQVDASGEGRGPEWARHELAWMVAFAATTPLPLSDVATRAVNAARGVSTGVAEPVFLGASEAAVDETTRVEQSRVMAAVVREVVGNPFRPVEFLPRWRTETAVTLARHIYDRRDYGAMPILADAIQEAGCEVEDVLNHCRDPDARHVRGCWVLDAVLSLSEGGARLCAVPPSAL